jgi:predicted transcriptional regulator
MAIAKSNAQVYATVNKEEKDKLQKLATKHKRSLSQEIAYALSCYLENEGESEKPA